MADHPSSGPAAAAPDVPPGSAHPTGYSLGPIDGVAFRDFAKRFARSPEVGPIATALDDAPDGRPGDPALRLFGLGACGNLAAAACLQLIRGRAGDSHALKLDSVVVHANLRQRGLGGLIVSHAFGQLAGDPAFNVQRIYAHAVHPATVALLARLGFSAPPVVGAPLSAIDIEGRATDFAAASRRSIAAQENYMRLQCALCRAGDRRARPWCKHDITKR